MSEFSKPMVTIELAEYQFLLEEKAKLNKKLSINGMSLSEYEKATAVVLAKAINDPEPFLMLRADQSVTVVGLAGTYIATFKVLKADKKGVIVITKP